MRAGGEVLVLGVRAVGGSLGPRPPQVEPVGPAESARVASVRAFRKNGKGKAG